MEQQRLGRVTNYTRISNDRRVNKLEMEQQLWECEQALSRTEMMAGWTRFVE